MQRILDILFSSLALLFLIPLFLFIILLLKFTGEGEILYRQPRLGKERRIFQIWKFSTMLKNSYQMINGDITVANDPRVLPIGKFLRFTKINELPQLVNILIGDMSIVGPRPLTPRTFSAYPMDLQELILKIRPGLSGIGSIVFRDEELLLVSENSPSDFYKNVIAPYKCRLEIWYMENNSLKNYFLLILMTCFALFFSNKRILWKIFKGLPLPPKELAKFLYIK
jgi:lipopolysaccharide/colanic/teichoic acid biosynthesis glycosyltransferase